MSEEDEKISCHICQNEIPKAAALNAEGEEYVYYFCHSDCLEHWKEREKGGGTNTES